MSPKLRSDLLLFLAAIIWGFAFVAQRMGMDFVGPFTYNGVRFTLGVLVLVPFLFFGKKFTPEDPAKTISKKQRFWGIIGVGLLLFAGVSLQQVGLQTTTAGKAGFITGLYVVLVPIVGYFLGHKSRPVIWIGVILSATGLYLLSIKSGFSIERGDLLVLGCAFVFTFHVLLIGWLSPRMNSFHLAAGHFAVCAVLCLTVAFLTELIEFSKIIEAAAPIIYGGVISVGIAYTLQVVAQKNAHPAYASIILSLEAVFAALGGWIILHETLSTRSFFGCFLMLAGMIVVQIRIKK
ncbi:MAG: DMT family transporter [Bacteroidetes bacterium]|nr:DMT family transporter [Bacteroidota bacterium]